MKSLKKVLSIYKTLVLIGIYFFGTFMEKCSGYELQNLLPTIQYSSTYFGLEIKIDYPIAAKIDPENVLKGHFEDFLSY